MAWTVPLHADSGVVRQDFSTDPNWEARNNRPDPSKCVTCTQDFGYSKTNHAGGQTGEIGGLVWRIESTRPQNSFYYAAPVRGLSLDRELEASGKVCLCAAAADSAIFVGWFNSHTYIGAPPNNFLGILIEGPSRIGHYVRPVRGSSDDVKQVMSQGPVIFPDGNPHTWTFRYQPEAGDGRGRITVAFDGESVSMDVSEAARKGNAAFDRFGFLSWNRGGHFVEIYFDDLVWTAGPSKNGHARRQ